MAHIQDKVTRFSAELVDDAAAEGARQSRSVRQQLDHWVRLGRAVSASTSSQRARVEAALSGHLALGDLGVEEAIVVHAEISTAIEKKLTTSNYGETLAAEGVTTVSLDEAGNLVQHLPDGSSAPCAAR